MHVLKTLERLRASRSLASIVACIAALTVRGSSTAGRTFDEYDYIIVGGEQGQQDVFWLAVSQKTHVFTFCCSNLARAERHWPRAEFHRLTIASSTPSMTTNYPQYRNAMPEVERYIGQGASTSVFVVVNIYQSNATLSAFAGWLFFYQYNDLRAHYGAPSDFDEFAEIVGDNSWSWENLKQYFLKFETYYPDPRFPNVDVSQRGSSGPVNIGYSVYTWKGSKMFIDACINAGIPFNPDFNTSNGTIGVNKTVTSSSQCLTSTVVVCECQLKPRTSLLLSLPVQILRSLPKLVLLRFSSTPSTPNGNPRAVGVEFSPFAQKGVGKRFSARARKEVIVCCGTVHTPQLLMLSGIGPATHLTEHNIPVIVDHPGVGSNLSDHAMLPMRLAEKPGTSLGYLQPSDLHTKFKLWRDLLEYKLRGTGPLSSNLVEGAAFCRSDDPVLFPEYRHHSVQDSTSGPGSPDLELVTMAVVNYTDRSRSTGSRFIFLPMLLRPTSVGTIRLTSADPWDDPLIDPNYLSTQHDIDVFVRGVRLAVKIAHTPPLSDLTDSTDDDPNLDHHFGRLSDEELQKIIRSRVESVYHPVGTCAMGREGVATTVLDPQMRVRGVSGLRVCDASILPKLVSGHTTGVVIAAAEKLADTIKAEYK
ncbi:hypothetical protein EDC04DRAFT_2968509 [Pisolithus marmoratus]|nr:hypothetical protein EDC04DRAFT_2968509 [Pisolithus marmoratus]